VTISPRRIPVVYAIVTKARRYSGNSASNLVKLTVAIGAKSDQIFSGIIAKCTTRTNMVYLKAFRGSAVLASPT
jgi:hypothetical protein